MDKLLKKAINRHNAGKLAEAVQLYKKILKQNPWHLDGNYMLGTLYAEQGQLAQAQVCLEKAAQIKSDSPYIQNNLGNVYRSQEKYAQAIQCFRRAIDLQPEMVQALNNLAVVLKLSGQLDEAENLFNRVLQLDPAFADARYNLGNIFWDRNEKAAAAACYQQVLETNPEHARALDRMGDYWLSKGDTHKALDCFNKYLHLQQADDCGVALKLAYLGKGDMPLRQPGQLVVETYEKKAASWERDVARADMAFLGPRQIEAWLNTVPMEPDSQDILDLGCGTGLCGEFLKSRAHRLVGVDLSPAMLALARAKNIYDELVADDVMAYMLNCRESFSLIIASGVLIFFSDLQPLLAAASKLLRPGGRMVFTAYSSSEADIAVRHNYHFAHSRNYLEKTAAAQHLLVERLDETVHEYEYGQAQAGFLVVLLRPTES